MSKDKKEPEKPKAEISPEEEAAKSKKKKLLIFAIGGAGLLLGVGGGLFFFLSGGSDKKAQAATPGEHGAAQEGTPSGEHGGDHGGEHGGDHGDEKAEGAHGEKKAEAGHGETKGHDGKDAKKDGKDAHGDGEKKAEGGKDAHGGGHGGDEKKAEGGHGGDKKKDDKSAAESKLEGVDFGCTIPLTPFHLNLGNPLENRYIRLEISVEYGCAEDQKAEINKRLPQLRDAIIAVTSRKTREFLLGPDGKEQLRKEIHNRVNHYMTKKIDDVYITDILIE
jgi:flagellar basal body-associated protein FliL